MSADIPEIEDARAVIDACDEKIISALAERVDAARRIGEMKRTSGVQVRDSGRESSLKKRHEELCARLGAPRDLVERLFVLIVEHSRTIQGELDDLDGRG